MGMVQTIRIERNVTAKKIEVEELAEIRGLDFLKNWLENNLDYFDEETENNLITKTDFENLKLDLEKALKTDYEEASEIFYELEEEDFKYDLKEILEIVEKALSFDFEKDEFYYSFYN